MREEPKQSNAGSSTHRQRCTLLGNGHNKPPPKRKQPQAEEESLDDSVLTVKMATSIKKTPKLALKGSLLASGQTKNQTCFASDSQRVTSQVTTILQLMEMVSMVQQGNKMIMLCFDQLIEQIAALLSAQSPSQPCKAQLEAMEVNLAKNHDDLLQLVGE